MSKFMGGRSFFCCCYTKRVQPLLDIAGVISNGSFDSTNDFRRTRLNQAWTKKNARFSSMKWDGGKRRPRMAAEKKNPNGRKRNHLPMQVRFVLIFSTVYDWKVIAMASRFN
ncbi:hypothetical protein CEXT_199451 [Caerostris extrusa]|uniref:Uncharacterized protein n=1 Tax=Caerostris extrusa TaxID=172846 RepID=A0AAV4WUK8_CAEEX|nr:hypothetical protein CEXT_199451 [Caerostris extrusa]